MNNFLPIALWFLIRRSYDYWLSIGVNDVTLNVIFFVSLNVCFGWIAFNEYRKSSNIIEKGIYVLFIIVSFIESFVNLLSVSMIWEEYREFVNNITMDFSYLIISISLIISSITIWLLQSKRGRYTSHR